MLVAVCVFFVSLLEKDRICEWLIIRGSISKNEYVRSYVKELKFNVFFFIFRHFYMNF